MRFAHLHEESANILRVAKRAHSVTACHVAERRVTTCHVADRRRRLATRVCYECCSGDGDATAANWSEDLVLYAAWRYTRDTAEIQRGWARLQLVRGSRTLRRLPEIQPRYSRDTAEIRSEDLVLYAAGPRYGRDTVEIRLRYG